MFIRFVKVYELDKEQKDEMPARTTGRTGLIAKVD
jgi:hypothetical protein